MQISSEAAAVGVGGGQPVPGTEPCRFPKLEECAHFHYERVQLPERLSLTLQTQMDQSLHSQHTNDDTEIEWFMVQVTSGDACWLIQRNIENFKMLDDQLHQCIFDRKISQLPDLGMQSPNDEELETKLIMYLERLSQVADNSVNCGPVLNWLQMDNKGRRLLVPSEESRSINTPAVAAAYSVRRYVSQARDELNLEVGDMISVIDMASPGESMWWRGKRGFQVGFFPQHCVHIIGDKVPRNMPLPPPVVGSLALTPIKPVLRKHGKLITFFRSFILNRPSRRRLKQSGILKERVFGCDLGEHLLNTGNDVPMVLKCCAEFIEKKGIVDGIYRLSGVTSNIQKLRNAFDEDRIPNLYTEDILQDIHSVASLLKMYFRELPNPLCTYQLYQSFVNAVQGCSTAIRNSETDHERLLKMREAVQKLPPPHYRTLEYLMRHLAKVAKHGTSTGMTTRNVAIVWAPNLLRCEALEVGGVAALQGVGVQAVVTEFLICYADLIFCDRLPNLDHPSLAINEGLLAKKCRPNSLAISTPAKLITLEEARNKHLPGKSSNNDCGYIEVGGGPGNLPEKYHTVIELPPGARKRGHTKRSPLGWRLFFSKSRNRSQGNLSKSRKSSTPITINEKSVTESDLTDMKRKLRTVKSAESLTSGHSEPVSSEDVLGPLHSLNKPPGHNRSVSHDSYFDTLQTSQNNSEGSLLDLSEIQLNFELEEMEMRIFSEDESLVSSPRIPKEIPRRILTRQRPDEEYHHGNNNSSNNNSVDPSPKKQPRVILSPIESQSRKRTRLEDQLSDIRYIDCSTPDNVVISTTTAVIHDVPESPVIVKEVAAAAADDEIVHDDDDQQAYELYLPPKNKSPRNSDKRQSLNLESMAKNSIIPKSFTEIDINRKFLGGTTSILTTPTPGSPGYKQLGESSSNTTPGISPSYERSPTNGTFHRLPSKPKTPTYENVLTTISIIYKSPPRSNATSPVKSPISNSPYENVVLNPEKVVIPTSSASLPVQEASQPNLSIINGDIFLQSETEERPKSLSALDDLNSGDDSTMKPNLSSGAICNTSEQLSMSSLLNDPEQTISSSKDSSASNIQYTASISSSAPPPPYHCMDNNNSEQLSPNTTTSNNSLSLSEVVVQGSTESINITTNRTSMCSYPPSPSLKEDDNNSPSPNVSPTQADDYCSSNNTTQEEDITTPLSPTELPTTTTKNNCTDDGVLSSEAVNLPVEVGNNTWSNINNDQRRPVSVNLIDFSPVQVEATVTATSCDSPSKQSNNEKRKSDDTESLDDDDNAIYQQVKYFRRSIHEVNALLDLKNTPPTSQENECTENIYEDIDLKIEECEKVVVKNEECLNIDVNVVDDTKSDCLEENNYDSLEPHVYVNIDGDSFRKNSPNKTDTLQEIEENSSISEHEEKQQQFESNGNGKISENAELPLEIGKIESIIATDDSTKKIVDNSPKLMKFYEKDSLPPCLRARNLKHQLKTRSLDEEEFEKEFGSRSNSRRTSFDEGVGGYKSNSLPKTLNQPKSLPAVDGKVESIHLAHSTENINNMSSEEEEQRKRERIERYKEERRRILQDKYRSESFKEDKEVLLTKLRIYKPKDDNNVIEAGKLLLSQTELDRLPRCRRRSHRSEDNLEICDPPIDGQESTKKQPIDQTSNTVVVKSVAVHEDEPNQQVVEKREPKPMRESLKSRAAIFEQNVQRSQPPPPTPPTSLAISKNRNVIRDTNKQIEPHTKQLTETKDKFISNRIDKKNDSQDDDLKDLDFIRNKRKDDIIKEERRRHTFDSRERETEAEKLNRISLENRSPKKEKISPTYCIKDMKAIFESKSKQ